MSATPSTGTAGGQRIAGAIRGVRDGPALVAFMTAGYPDRAAFPALLGGVAAAADVVEVGVPFSDPMADGATIQRASRIALEGGATLEWILLEIGRLRAGIAAPMVLMSYLNPLLSFGPDRLADRAAESGVAGFIVPDLPIEESDLLAAPLRRAGVGLVQMVTPVTPRERLRRLAESSDGFVYAVTVTGVTGGDRPAAAGTPGDALERYLERVREVSTVPVCAGFGIRTGADVARLRGHADGVIVGSALIEAIEAGRDAGTFLRSLRQQRASAS